MPESTPVCPACNLPLRAFANQLCCDRCEGIMVALPDLVAAIEDLTGEVPKLVFFDDAAGKRACPRCAAGTPAMTTCRVRIEFPEDKPKAKPQLDRCAEHGVWFDRDELAAVFEAARHVASRGPRGGGSGGGGRSRVQLPSINGRMWGSGWPS